LANILIFCGFFVIFGLFCVLFLWIVLCVWFFYVSGERFFGVSERGGLWVPAFAGTTEGSAQDDRGGRGNDRGKVLRCAQDDRGERSGRQGGALRTTGGSAQDDRGKRSGRQREGPSLRSGRQGEALGTTEVVSGLCWLLRLALLLRGSLL
jgi:hypothetical protein